MVVKRSGFRELSTLKKKQNSVINVKNQRLTGQAEAPGDEIVDKYYQNTLQKKYKIYEE